MHVEIEGQSHHRSILNWAQGHSRLIVTSQRAASGQTTIYIVGCIARIDHYWHAICRWSLPWGTRMDLARPVEWTHSGWLDIPLVRVHHGHGSPTRYNSLETIPNQKCSKGNRAIWDRSAAEPVWGEVQLPLMYICEDVVRVMGILQRISLCYCAVSIIHAVTNYGDRAYRYIGALVVLGCALIYVTFMITFQNA